MWVFVFFDLPTTEREDRYHYRKFHDFLLKQGFDMHQYSVYKRFATSIEHRDSIIKTVEKNLPPHGDVSVMYITDKQFGQIKHFFMSEPEIPPEKKPQIMMF